MKSLYLCENCCYSSPWIVSFDLSRYKNLKSLYIGIDSFYDVKRFELKGLKKLESVDIYYAFNSVVGTVSLTNCLKLKDLRLGGFSGTESFEIRDLSSLESLTIGGSLFGSTRR